MGFRFVLERTLRYRRHIWYIGLVPHRGRARSEVNRASIGRRWHHGYLLVVGSVKEFRIWLSLGVDHKKLLVTTTEHSVHAYFAVFDANHCACTSINGIIFYAGAVAEDDYNLFVALCTYQRLKSCDPVGQCVHIRFLGHTTEMTGIFPGQPSHMDNDQIRLHFQDVKCKFESMPGGFELVRTVSC